MEVKVTRSDQNFQFTATNAEASIDLCATPELSGDAKGFRPMELLLVSLGGCLSIDVLSILEKQKQEVERYDVKVKASRVDRIPAIFKDIIIEVYVWGNVEENKLKRAISLSEEKYCSVHHIMGETANITCKYFLNHEE